MLECAPGALAGEDVGAQPLREAADQTADDHEHRRARDVPEDADVDVLISPQATTSVNPTTAPASPPRSPNSIASTAIGTE